MTLKDVVNDYVAERDLSNGHAENLRRTVRYYCDYIGREPDEFEYETVNRFLTNMIDRTSRSTARLHRRGIVTIWNSMSERYGCEYPVSLRIKQIRVAHDPPKAFSVEQIGLLRESAASLGGDYEGCPRSVFWQATISLAFETGFRRGDLFRLPRSIEDGERFTLRESKTGQIQVRQVSEQTAELLRSMPPNPLALPWTLNPSTFTKTFNKIRDRAELDGQFKWLRRAFVTYSGWRHCDPAISRRHYIDATLVEEPVPTVPEITSSKGESGE